MQIKVNNIIDLPQKGGSGGNISYTIPVVEGKLVLISTKEDALLAFNQYRGEYYILPEKGARLKMPAQYLKPIIISEIETDVDECPVLCLDELEHGWQEAYRPEGRGEGGTCTECKKILALPENFSPKYLQAIVDGKMKNGNKVLIECERVTDDEVYFQGLKEYKINLNSSNHVTLHTIEEKLYTKTEMRDHFMKFIWKFTNIHLEDIDEYFNNNIK